MEQFANFIVRKYKYILLIGLGAMIISLFFAGRLSLKTNMASVLPEESETIMSQNEFEKYFDSQENVLVIAQGDSESCKSYLEDLEKTLRNTGAANNILYKVENSALNAYLPLYVETDVYRQIESGEIRFSDIQSVFSTPETGDNTYLVSEDEDTYMMVIKPDLDYQDIMASKEHFFEVLDEVLEQTGGRHPDITAGYTGGAFVQDHESDMMVFDSLLSSAIGAFILIILLIILSFRRILLPALSGLPLFLGVLLTAAFAYIVYGSIDFFSISFAALLFGLGIDFAVHILNRFYEEYANGLTVKEAVIHSLKKSGRGIIIGAITTAAVFFAFIFAEFKAFTPMGVLSGTGIIILCLIMLLVVPSMIILFEQLRKKSDKQIKAGTFWFLKHTGRFSERFAVPVIIAFTVILGVLVIPAGRSEISGNMSDIYPEDMSCLKWLDVVEEEFDYNPNTLSFMVDDWEGLENSVETLSKRDDVKSIESVCDYMPEEQDFKIDVLKKLGIEQEPMKVDDLPEEIKGNFVGKEGKLLIEVVPETDIWEEEAFEVLRDAIYEVSGRVPVGFPAVTNEVVGYVKGDILKICLICIALILIFLIISFKSFKKALITMVPVACSLYITIALLEAFGVGLNILSVVGLPILIGIGIDSGVHMMHRLLTDDDLPSGVMHTGKAVIVTTLTTLIGFGSLAVSNHPGLAGLGLCVIIGMAVCMIVTICVLPALKKTFIR